MKMRKLAVTAALAATALGVTAGTANAAPAPSAPAAPATSTTASATAATGVNYTAHRDGQSVVIKTDAGSMVNDHGVFKIVAANGTVLAGTPLAYRVNNLVLPVAAKITGHTAVLTPDMNVKDASYKPTAKAKEILLPFQDQGTPWKTPYDRDVDAFNWLKNAVSIGGSLGSVGGLLSGAALGCAAGALLGAVATGIVADLFGLGPLGGCIASAGVFAVLGAVAGTLLITAPVAIAALAEYFITTNEPFVPPKPAKPQPIIVVGKK